MEAIKDGIREGLGAGRGAGGRDQGKGEGAHVERLHHIQLEVNLRKGGLVDWLHTHHRETSAR